MSKAIISNRIYFKVPDQAYKEKVIESLTYRIEDKHAKHPKASFKMVETIKNYKLLPKDIISIPQGREDLIPEGYEIEDRRVFNEVPFPNPLVPMREAQKELYDLVDDTCFVNALVGWGKCFAL